MSAARFSWLATAAAVCLLASACGSDEPTVFPDDGRDGGGGSSSSSGGIDPGDGGSSSGDGASGGTPGVITVTLRDFQHWSEDDDSRNPDFENVPGPPQGQGEPYFGPWTESEGDYLEVADDGTTTLREPEYRVSIVGPDLGADGKPVYNEDASYEGQTGRTATTHGKAFFDQWYRDVPGTNVTVQMPLTLQDMGNGVFSYDSASSGVPRSTDGRRQFFPLDGQGFGNTPESVAGAGLDHNYHFTMELHTVFTYAGDETFRFTGDDDIFVFINRKRVIDIGGIHGVAQQEVSLPELAERLGITPGNEYAFDLFQAERHVTGSNVRLDTTIRLRPTVPN